MKIRILLAAVCCLAASLGAQGANEVTPAEKAAGWRLLFDGRTLAGWRGFTGVAPGAGWAVQDGAIVRTAKSGDLLTIDEFGDFELAVEWKIEQATNSGILYRVGLGAPQTYHTGPEYQILDNRAAHDRFDPTHLAASLYGLVAASRDVTRPIGRWNETRIVVRGWHIQHWLNGVQVVDVDLGAPAGRALIAGSKFKAWPGFATLARGHIALQDHDHQVSFRSIKVRELAPAPASP